MAIGAAQTILSPEEYISFERKFTPDAETVRHEYLGGKIISMSGASYAYNLIGGNINLDLGNRLKGSGCFVLSNEMRVSSPPTSSYFYPDLLVLCDEPQFEDNQFDTLLNPIVIIEILSPTRKRTTEEKNSHTTVRLNRCRNIYSFHKRL